MRWKMNDSVVTSGYLIEKTFARVCHEFLAMLRQSRPHLVDKKVYAAPYGDVAAEQMSKQYRGLQREPIQAWHECLRGSGVVEPIDRELEASLLLYEFTQTGRADDDFIFAIEDARELVRRIEPPVERDIIWARRMDACGTVPAETELLGYEPSAFYPPCCTSAVAEGMFFSVWMREREEYPQIRRYLVKLNRWGLFNTPIEAAEFLESYLSLLPMDWDEHREKYYVTEVRAVGE
jgi:hypothetical protein